MSATTDLLARANRDRLDKIEKLLEALRSDITAIISGASPEPGLRVPSFPKLLRELGLEPPPGIEYEGQSKVERAAMRAAARSPDLPPELGGEMSEMGAPAPSRVAEALGTDKPT